MSVAPVPAARIVPIAGILALCLTPVAGSVQPGAPQPMMQWTFDAAHVDGNRVRSTAGPIDASVVGPVKPATDGPASLILDGKANRVVIGDPDAPVPLPREAVSIEAWCRMTVTGPWGAVVSAVQDNGSFERGWMLGHKGPHFCFGLASEKANRITYLTAPNPIVPEAWYHLVATYDGRSMRLFVDGRPVASSADQSGPVSYPDRQFHEIGAYHDDDELYPIRGRVRQVAIFDTALGEEEVARRFAADKDLFPGIESAPVERVSGWPTYMHDDRRSGITAEGLSLPLAAAWTYRTRHAPAPAWPPPAKHNFWHNKHNLKPRVVFDRAYHTVSDGSRVVFGTSADDRVVCLDIASGRRLWHFFAEGPVRLAPTLHEGRAYFGADDGLAYCLDLADGSLIWKRPIVERDRRIPGNGRMMSVWPIRTGIGIDARTLRLAAGLFPSEGVTQAVLDAESGRPIATGALTFSPQGYIQRAAGRWMMATGRTGPVQAAASPPSSKTAPPSLGAPPEGFPCALVGTDDLRIAGGDGRVAAFDAATGEQRWSAPVDGKAWSLAVADGRLLVGTDRGSVHCFHTAAETSGQAVELAESAIPPPETDPATESRYDRAVERILAAAPLRRGYCLVLAGDEGHLAHRIASRTDMSVIAVEPDSGKVAGSREHLFAAGLYGRVVVHHGPLDRLPYGDGLFNLIVVDGSLRGTTATPDDEIRRLLCPGRGVAVLGDLAGDDAATRLIHRPSEPGSGSWTHFYANPGNTACSGDVRVGGELAVQWFGPPGPRDMVDRHHRTFAPLSVSGRLFVPGDNCVFAVDANNGTPLWRADVPDSRRVGGLRDAGNMAADGDSLYLAVLDKCLRFDAESGRVAATFHTPPAEDGKPRHWGYVARVDDALLGSTTQPGAARTGHSRQAIAGTYYDGLPIVTADGLFRVDRADGSMVWRYECRAGAIAHPTLAAGDGRLYFVESDNRATLDAASGRATPADLLGAGCRLVALDVETGRTLWQRPADLAAIQHHLYLMFAQGRLVAVGTKNHRTSGQTRPTAWYDTHVFSAADGTPLWTASQNNGSGPGGSHGEQDHHPAIVGDVVIVEPKAYDLATGDPVEPWAFARGGGGCGTVSASMRALFFRAGNPTAFELAEQQRRPVTRVSRPGCWINMIPAGGLLLIPEASSGCTCGYSIQTSMALRPIEPVPSD